MVNVYDGSRQPLRRKNILYTLIDGNKQVQSRQFHTEPFILFSNLPLFNNVGDNYEVLVAADGYKDVGYYPVKLAANAPNAVDLMLIPRSDAFNFVNATWKALGSFRPDLKALFASGASNDQAATQRYNDIMENQGGEILASLLNVTAAMGQINLPQGTPLDYTKRIIWDRNGKFAMARDQVFAWVDPELIDQIAIASHQPTPTFAPFPPALVGAGATSAYKQIQFGEANLAITLFESDRQTIDEKTCIRVAFGFDYFKDPASHIITEVTVNGAGQIADPRAVYLLRWSAGRHAGVPEFDPLYTIIQQ